MREKYCSLTDKPRLISRIQAVKQAEDLWWLVTDLPLVLFFNPSPRPRALVVTLLQSCWFALIDQEVGICLDGDGEGRSASLGGTRVQLLSYGDKIGFRKVEYNNPLPHKKKIGEGPGAGRRNYVSS